MDFEFSFQAKLWVYQVQAAWYFVSLPVEVADNIKAISKGRTRAWGSLKVHATIGATSWQTSLFRDSKTNTYILPVKATVRNAEKLELEQTIHVLIKIGHN